MRIRMINQVLFEATFGIYIVICGSVCGSAWYVYDNNPFVFMYFQADSVMSVLNAY